MRLFRNEGGTLPLFRTSLKLEDVKTHQKGGSETSSSWLKTKLKSKINGLKNMK